MKHVEVFGLVLVLVQSLISAPVAFVSKDGNDANGGTSWADAKATIPAALNIADAGGEVRVSNCIIRDNTANKVSPVYVTGGLLIDSLMTNNLANAGYNNGIAGLHITGGTVRHCRIVKNTSNNRSSNTAGVQQEGGTVADCFIVGNSGPSMAEGNGNAAAGVRMSGGLMERCSILCNTNTYTSYNPAGGIYVLGNGTVRNCLIAGNQARRSTRATRPPGVRATRISPAHRASAARSATSAPTSISSGVPR